MAGQTPKSIEAFANLKEICETHLKGKYRIEVIDLVENPELAKMIRFWQFLHWLENFQNP